MVRIFDLDLYYASKNRCCHRVSRDFTLALNVTDTFLSRNNRTIYLKVSGWIAAAVVPQTSANVTLCTDISDLSSFVMGSYPLKQAVAFGRMSQYFSDQTYLDDIQNAIGWDTRPVNITYF